MCGGGKQQTSTSTFNSQAAPQLQDLITRATNVSNTAYNPSTQQQVAGFTAPQNQAFSSITGGLMSPYLAQAGQYAQQGAAPITTQDIMARYNPMIDAQVSALQNDFATQNARELSNVNAQASKLGALTGSQSTGARALAAESQRRQQDPVLANLRSNAFNNAYGAAQADRSASQWGAGTQLGLGQAAFTDPNAQLAVGNQQQAQAQNVLNAQSANAQAQSAYPFQTTQWLASILNPTAGTMGGTTTSTQPGPNMWNTVGGLLSTGVGAFMASDRDAKHDIKPVGQTFDGLPIYTFKMNGGETPQMGLMAQDVEKRDPGAVAETPAGLKMVNYDRATAPAASLAMSAGGAVDPDMANMTASLRHAVDALRPFKGFATGGAPQQPAMTPAPIPYANAPSYVPQVQVMASPPPRPAAPSQSAQQSGPDLSNVGKAVGSWMAKPAQPTSVGYGNSWSPIVSDFRVPEDMMAFGGRVGYAKGGAPAEWDSTDNRPIFAAPAEEAQPVADLPPPSMVGAPSALNPSAPPPGPPPGAYNPGTTEDTGPPPLAPPTPTPPPTPAQVAAAPSARAPQAPNRSIFAPVDGKSWYEFGSNPELGRYLMAFGAGALQNQSPFFGPGVGSGASAALGMWQERQEAARKEREINMRADQLAQQARQFQQTHGLAQQRFSQDKRVQEPQIAIAEQNLEELKNPSIAYDRRETLADRLGLAKGTRERNEFIATGDFPKLAKDSLTALAAERAIIADQLGLVKGSPAYQTFIATGRMGRDETMPAADRKAIQEAVQSVSDYDIAIKQLDRALELNDKANTGFLAGARAAALNLTPYTADEASKATRELSDILSREAITQMSQTLKGASTDREMFKFIEMAGDVSLPPDLRAQYLNTAKQKLLAHRETAATMANEIRGGTLYKPGGDKTSKSISQMSLEELNKLSPQSMTPQQLKEAAARFDELIKSTPAP